MLVDKPFPTGLVQYLIIAVPTDNLGKSSPKHLAVIWTINLGNNRCACLQQPLKVWCLCTGMLGPQRHKLLLELLRPHAIPNVFEKLGVLLDDLLHAFLAPYERNHLVRRAWSELNLTNDVSLLGSDTAVKIGIPTG